ncbi:hypothetical protein G6F35_012955 [Rhizopus arrhizus]|nr:hypothetical protein G6F35_012955 [Rhizopus arrhizus]
MTLTRSRSGWVCRARARRGHQAPAGRAPGGARSGAAGHAGRFAGYGNAGWLRTAVYRRAGAHRWQHRGVRRAWAGRLTVSGGAGRSDRHHSTRPV